MPHTGEMDHIAMAKQTSTKQTGKKSVRKPRKDASGAKSAKAGVDAKAAEPTTASKLVELLTDDVAERLARLPLDDFGLTRLHDAADSFIRAEQEAADVSDEHLAFVAAWDAWRLCAGHRAEYTAIIPVLDMVIASWRLAERIAGEPMQVNKVRKNPNAAPGVAMLLWMLTGANHVLSSNDVRSEIERLAAIAKGRAEGKATFVDIPDLNTWEPSPAMLSKLGVKEADWWQTASFDQRYDLWRKARETANPDELVSDAAANMAAKWAEIGALKGGMRRNDKHDAFLKQRAIEVLSDIRTDAIAVLTAQIRYTGSAYEWPENVWMNELVDSVIWYALHLLAESVANRSLYRHHNDLIDLEEWAWRQIRKRIDPACTRLYGWPTSELAIVES